jgi:hypothetical protein
MSGGVVTNSHIASPGCYLREAILMTDTTIVFRLADKRLTPDEREMVLELSRKLYTRDGGTATRTPPHPNALAATHWGKRPDGDL